MRQVTSSLGTKIIRAAPPATAGGSADPASLMGRQEFSMLVVVIMVDGLVVVRCRGRVFRMANVY